MAEQSTANPRNEGESAVRRHPGTRIWLGAGLLGLGVLLAAVVWCSLGTLHRAEGPQSPSVPPPSETPREPTAKSSSENGVSAHVIPDPAAPVPTTPDAVIVEARRLAAWIVAAYPNDPDAYEVAARVEFWLGDSAEAVRCWQRCLELNPAYGYAYHGMGLVAAKAGEHEKAVELFRKTLEVMPASAAPRLDMGDALARLGKVDEAMDVFEDALKSAPDPTRALVPLGKLYLEKKEFRKAQRAFDGVLRLRPDHANALFGMATACRGLGQTQKAEEYLARFKGIRTQEKQDRHTMRGQYDDLDAMRRELATAYVTAGHVCRGSGHRSAAEKLCGRAATVAPADVAGREKPASMSRETGRPEQSSVAAKPGRPLRDAPKSMEKAREIPAGLTPIVLHDATVDTGIGFRHTDGSSGRRYIMEAMSCGVATFDYDGDGLIDIYFPNGATLPGATFDRPPRHALYKNLGGFRFREVTDEAGVGCTGYGLGATAGDYDNDGWPDLYVSNFGPKVLYHNNGDGKFSDATRQAGVADGNKVGAGVAFFDMDGDGDLDLYVANYVKFSYATHRTHTVMGVPSYPGPLDYLGEPATLFRNRGDGAFADVSVESGVAACPGRGMGVTCADYDNDGRTDVFVCNDVQENFLFRNDGRGKFQEIAMISGVAYDAVGQPRANMGVDSSDYDHDGWLDFYVTAYQTEGAALYRNLRHGLLEDVTHRAAAGEGTFANVTWGCAWGDFNNDGHRDLFVACGHTEDNIESYDDSTSYRARNVLLVNTGKGKFLDVSDTSGDGMLAAAVSRGAALDDLDNDGDLDVVVLNSRDKPTILRNMLHESGPRNHWLQVRLRGAKTNRDGVGARVTVVAGDLRQIDEVHSGRGYQSHWGSRLHFGLGRRDRIDRIEVRWIGGGVDVLEDVRADQQVTITEGSRSS